MVWVLQYSLHIANVLLYIRYSNSLDGNESRYSIQRKSVEEFKKLCPYTDLCYSQAYRNSMDVFFPKTPCCKPCDCDVNIVTRSCPDRPLRFLNDTEVLHVKQATEQCVLAQLRRYSLYKLNGDAYTMIGKCPMNYKDADIKAKCLREYHEFDFENDDVRTLMPVSSESLNVTFRNYYCAICHGATQAKLQFWETKLECKNERTLLISSIYEIPLGLSEEPQCQALFVPPYRTPVNTCSGAVDRCNVTGTWKAYDKNMESACLSYTSVYKNFRNIHCYVCNGHSFTDIEDICISEDTRAGTESFVAMLDFNDLEGPSSDLQVKEKNCPRTSKYDPYKKECRPMFCSHGMMLSKERCVPLYKKLAVFETSSTVFGLRINLLPNARRIRTWHHLEDLALSVFTDIYTKMLLINTAYDVSICAFNTYMKLTHSLEDIVLLMGLGNETDVMPFVSYLAIVAKFKIGSLSNISETLEELAVIFTVNDNYAQYFIQYPSDNNLILKGNQQNISDTFLANLSALVLDHRQHIMFMRGFNDPDDGFGIVSFQDGDPPPVRWSPECVIAMSVQPRPFCPRIELTRSEFNIDIDGRKVTTRETDTSPLNLIFSKVLSSKRNKSVLVCADEYFSQLPPENHSDVNDTLVIMTITCLVPSIASLILSFLAYCALPKLRNIPGLNNMALVLHLLIAQILALVNTFTDIEMAWLCTAIGIVLHYTLLSSFFWMFICTFHMMLVFVQIKQRSPDAHTMRKFVPYLLFVEVIAVLLVAVNVVVSVLSSGSRTDFGYGGSSCYITRSNMILFFVAVPLGIVLAANLIMFIFVVCRVASLPDMAKNSNRERKNILIFAKLSTLTGITWIFGLLYQFFDVILFAYFYIVFTAGQGVFIMLSFVINKRVFYMIHARWRKKSRDNSKGLTQPVTVSTITGNEMTANNVSCDTKF